MSDDDDDDDILNRTVDTGLEVTVDPLHEINAVIDDLEALLKNGDVIGALTQKGINASIALVAAVGLRAYLTGDKATAAEDLTTAGEEIRARLQEASPKGANGTKGAGN
jgi:hypothetical protein